MIVFNYNMLNKNLGTKQQIKFIPISSLINDR